jgi:site-specific DNA-methyltransferase (adenine-specific)
VIHDSVIPGDCRAILKTLSSDSVDFILTDPPYFVDYKDRGGRTIRNDSYPAQVLEAFRDLRRVLKPNRLCVSFYGWQHVDAFAAIWRKVDLKPVGHIVFR